MFILNPNWIPNRDPLDEKNHRSTPYACIPIAKRINLFAAKFMAPYALTSFFYRLPSFWLVTTAPRSFQYSTYYYLVSVLLLYYTAYINLWYLLRKQNKTLVGKPINVRHTRTHTLSLWYNYMKTTHCPFAYNIMGNTNKMRIQVLSSSLLITDSEFF